MTEKKQNQSQIELAIARLQSSYMDYMAALKHVLDFGEGNIPFLVAALNHKHAMPVAKALGLMTYSPAVEQAFDRLFDWLIVQSPMYPEVLEALVRAGDKALTPTLQKIKEYADRKDDEAVRNLLDLAGRVSTASMPDVVSAAVELLKNDNPFIREAAADAIWRIGLPYAQPAEEELLYLVQTDKEQAVQRAAREALARLGKVL